MRAIKLSLPSKKGRQAPTSSSLVRSKRTSPNDDIDDTWNDDEENDDDPAVTASSTKRAVQPDPMKEALACRANIAKLKHDHYEGLYVELGRVTLIARGFDRNKKSWARFVKRSFWGKAREQDRPHVGHEKRSKIAFVTRFVFKPRTKNQFKRTSKFSGVLEFILGKGVKPENIAEELKKRRIGKIHPLVTKKPRPSGRNIEKSNRSAVKQKKRKRDDRTSNKTKGPILRWNTRTKKAANRYKFAAGVLLDCDVIEPKNGRTRYKVVDVTKRK
jgi:hypothetical protein